MKDKEPKLKMVELTLQEWFEGLKVPPPHRNKKKFKRGKKHKNERDE
jgi:hypothetical protein